MRHGKLAQNVQLDRETAKEREGDREREGVATGLQNEHSVIPKNFADIKFHLISFRFSQSPNFYLNKISCKFLSNSQKSQHGILNTYVQSRVCGIYMPLRPFYAYVSGKNFSIGSLGAQLQAVNERTP